MRTLLVTLVLTTLATMGCAAAGGDEPTAPPMGNEEADGPTGTSRDALISGGTSSSGTSYCGSLQRCYNDCYDNYPRGGGPLQTCKSLCDKTSSCTTVNSIYTVAF